MLSKSGIIIGGPPRSGKSTLARKVSAALGWTLVHGDSLVGAFEDVFPSLDITHGGPTLDSICNAFEPWIFRYLDKLTYYRIPYVFESYHVRPESLHRHGLTDRAKILYVGYPCAKVEQKFRDVRDHSTEPDWMSPLDDGEVKLYLERFTKTSQYFRQESERFGIEFIDLSEQFEERIDLLVRRLQSEQLEFRAS